MATSAPRTRRPTAADRMKLLRALRFRALTPAAERPPIDPALAADLQAEGLLTLTSSGYDLTDAGGEALDRLAAEHPRIAATLGGVTLPEPPPEAPRRGRGRPPVGEQSEDGGRSRAWTFTTGPGQLDALDALRDRKGERVSGLGGSRNEVGREVLDLGMALAPHVAELDIVAAERGITRAAAAAELLAEALAGTGSR